MTWRKMTTGPFKVTVLPEKESTPSAYQKVLWEHAKLNDTKPLYKFLKIKSSWSPKSKEAPTASNAMTISHLPEVVQGSHSNLMIMRSGNSVSTSIPNKDTSTIGETPDYLFKDVGECVADIRNLHKHIDKIEKDISTLRDATTTSNEQQAATMQSMLHTHTTEMQAIRGEHTNALHTLEKELDSSITKKIASRKGFITAVLAVYALFIGAPYVLLYNYADRVASLEAENKYHIKPTLTQLSKSINNTITAYNSSNTRMNAHTTDLLTRVEQLERQQNKTTNSTP